MKKLCAIFVLISLLLCGCMGQSEKYKENIFTLVNNNQILLTDYISKTNFSGEIPETLSSIGIKAIEVDQNNTVIFEMYYTGLFDGGVEYGFYYTENNHKPDKSFSSNDYTLTEAICGDFYYYEWHNG